MARVRWCLLALCSSLALIPFSRCKAQESPYFVTYDHYLEEPGNLEVEYFSTLGSQRAGNGFHSYWLELEYGATGWWTTELYLDAQSTFHDSTVYSGVKWENRFRPLKREHWINPILYVEYENLNGTDKTLKDIVGHDVEADFLTSNAEARREHKHEIEAKLILSSTVKGWNFSENFVAEKNLGHAPWEFGYALGASRPLSLKASAKRCVFCPQNFAAGVEMYGGLGDTYSLGLHETSHYLAPAAVWNLPAGWAVRVSPGFGLNDNSHKFLLRFGVSREFSGFGEMVRHVFGGKS